jgi:hypothetical protein
LQDGPALYRSGFLLRFPGCPIATCFLPGRSLLCRFGEEWSAQFAQETAKTVVPGADVVFLTIGITNHKLAEAFDHKRFAIPLFLGLSLMEVPFPPHWIATSGLMMIENSKCSHIGAKLAGLRREDTAVIHTEEETEVGKSGLVLVLEIPVFLLLAQIGDEIAHRKRSGALLVAVHAPPDAMLIVLSKRATVNVDQGEKGLLSECHRASFLFVA